MRILKLLIKNKYLRYFIYNFLVAVTSLLCTLLLSSSLKAEEQQINIGILALRGVDKTISMWTPTAKYLSDSIPGYHFNIVPLTNDNIQMAVKLKSIDFALTNPALYATLEAVYGVSRISTLKNRRMDGAYTRFGAVIFTHKDNTHINSLQNLKNQSFMAVHPNAFGGWWMALNALNDAGIHPDEDFSKILFSGLPQDNIVFAVRDKRVIAGTVRSDILERMETENKIQLSDFKILNLQQPAKFPFLLSTKLYPEWAFATLKHTNEALAQRVTIALLSLPGETLVAKSANSAGWTVPLDYQPVHELMMKLKVGPYKDLGKFNLKDVIKKYAQWALLIFILIIALSSITIYVFKLNRQLKFSKNSLEHSNKNLEFEIDERKRAQQAEHIQKERIRALYEISGISGISFDQQIDKTLTLGCRLLDMEIGRVCRIDSNNNTNTLKHVVSTKSTGIQNNTTVDLSISVCSITFQKESPLVIHHIKDSELAKHPSYQVTNFESYIGTSILVNGEKFGTINFASYAPKEPFTESDEDLLLLIGRWISVALERQLEEQTIKHAKESAIDANHAKSSFLANVSHELRTPLNAIIGYSEILHEDACDTHNTQLANDILKIKKAGRNLLSLINDVLDLSKIEAGKLELSYSQFKIENLLSELSISIDPLVHKNNNSLELIANDSQLSIECDFTKLRQILLNILSNACKFTDNGRITLSVTEECKAGIDWVYFRISDTGMGMNENDVKSIFQEFRQVGASDKHKAMGTGLGLAISQQFCLAMGGNISVSSVQKFGSTFKIKLPKHKPVSNIEYPSARDSQA